MAEEPDASRCRGAHVLSPVLMPPDVRVTRHLDEVVVVDGVISAMRRLPSVDCSELAASRSREAPAAWIGAKVGRQSVVFVVVRGPVLDGWPRPFLSPL
jgi:hypothetical protein